MSKIFMTKSSGDAEWGFDLATVVKEEQNTSSPIIKVIKVDNDSPSYGKLQVGDCLLDIAGNSTKNMSLADAWEVIKKCSNALFLTIERNETEQATSDPVNETPPKNTTTIRAMASALEQATQSPSSKPIEQSTRTSQYTNVSMANQSPKPFRAAVPSDNIENVATAAEKFIPDAPPLSEELIKQNSWKLTHKNKTTADSGASQSKVSSEYEQRIPEKLLKSMTKPGMKPFTYTPRGIDLQEVMEKARSRRHAHRRSQVIQPEDRQIEQSILETSHQQPAARTVQQMSASFSGQPWNPPVAQSKSFHRLQGWVEENQLVKQDVTQMSTMSRSPVARAIEESNVASNLSNRTIPSNTFRILQQSCGGADLSGNPNAMAIEREKYEKERATQELYRRVPARDREHEPEAHKYQGADIPSKSFRLLQEYTITDKASTSGIPSPQIVAEPDPKPYEDRNVTVPSRSFRLLQQLSGEGSSLEPAAVSSKLRNTGKQSSVGVYSTDF